MENKKVNDVERNAQMGSAELPGPPVLSDPDSIQFQPPSSNISSISTSNFGSSGDEIAHVDGQAPPKKTHGGKKNFSYRYDLSEYTIEQLAEYDDVDLVKPWHRKLILIHPFVIAWVFVTYAAYYGYRVWCNYQFRLVKGGLADASWIFICVEGVILCKWFYMNDVELSLCTD